MKNPDLRRRQLDSMLSKLPSLSPLPKSGWIATIRQALLMTSAQLAQKLGIDQSSLSRLEKSEIEKTITLKSLERAAKALDCEVRYVFIPTQSLDKMLFERAKKKLQQRDKHLEHTLALEAQQTDNSNELRTDIRAAFLLQELGSKVWDDE